MKSFITLLMREWREWRTVIIFLSCLYVLGLVGSAVMFYKGNEILFRSMQENALDVVFVLTHMQRGGVSFINLILMILALFYLADAVYKERADGSTFFYRSLPVGDMLILSSKLLAGMVGFLVISFVMGVILVLFTQLVFPGDLGEWLKMLGASTRLANLDFIGDWATFHFIQLLWLLPFATYMLFVSTVSRSRPLLIGVGAPLLLGLLWLWIMKDDGLLALFSSNLSAITSALRVEWLMASGPPEYLSPGPVELFGSFASYIVSLRTLISLLVAGGFYMLTLFAYRRNLPVS